MRRLILFAVVFSLLCLFFTGCNSTPTVEPGPVESTDDPQSVQNIFSQSDIQFILPGDFIDYTGTPIGGDYTFLYANGNLGLIGIEERKDEAGYTVFDDYLADQADTLGSELTQKDGFWTLTYIDNTQNESQTMLCIFYESTSSFWTVKAYCPEDVYSMYQADMWTYATSAKLN